MKSDLSPILPEKFHVITRSRRCSGSVSDIIPAFYVGEFLLSDMVFTEPNIEVQPKGVAGTIHAVRDTVLSLYNVAGASFTNQAAVDALCAQLGTAFFDWRSVSIDLVLNGINAVTPCGILDTIEFRYDSTDQWTRAQSAPWNGEPEEFQHFDPATANCTDSANADPVAKAPYLEGYGPPESMTGGVAEATATVVGGSVTAVTVTVGGTYGSAPLVAFEHEPGGGRGAKATATVVGGTVTAVAVTAGGSGYSTAHPPIVSFNGGGTHLQRTVYLWGLEDGRPVRYFSRYQTIV